MPNALIIERIIIISKIQRCAKHECQYFPAIVPQCLIRAAYSYIIQMRGMQYNIYYLGRLWNRMLFEIKIQNIVIHVCIGRAQKCFKVQHFFEHIIVKLRCPAILVIQIVLIDVDKIYFGRTANNLLKPVYAPATLLYADIQGFIEMREIYIVFIRKLLIVNVRNKIFKVALQHALNIIWVCQHSPVKWQRHFAQTCVFAR